MFKKWAHSIIQQIFTKCLGHCGYSTEQNTKDCSPGACIMMNRERQFPNTYIKCYVL